MFKNVNPKVIRAVEDRLESVHHELHIEKSLSEAEAFPLELEERELVRALENLYEDKHPKFEGGRGGHWRPDLGKYISPHEDNNDG